MQKNEEINKDVPRAQTMCLALLGPVLVNVGQPNSPSFLNISRT